MCVKRFWPNQPNLTKKQPRLIISVEFVCYDGGHLNPCILILSFMTVSQCTEIRSKSIDILVELFSLVSPNWRRRYKNDARFAFLQYCCFPAWHYSPIKCALSSCQWIHLFVVGLIILLNDEIVTTLRFGVASTEAAGSVGSLSQGDIQSAPW